MESKRGVLVPVGHAPAVLGDISGASTDEQIIALFLDRYRGKSACSVQSYTIDIRLFREALPVQLAHVTARDLLDFQAGKLTPTPPHRRRVSAVKSLFRFATRLGYLRLNPAEVIELTRAKDTLAERILTPEQVAALFEQNPDDPGRQLLVRFLYGTGARIHEALSVSARDLRDRQDGMGQVTLFGKRKKTRAVLLPIGLWAIVRRAVPAPSLPDTMLFRWSVRRAQEIVKEMGVAAGIPKATPHWLRHAHGSHAAMLRVPLHVIRDTLGHADLATTSHYVHAMPDESSALALEKKR